MNKPVIKKSDPSVPAFAVKGGTAIALRSGATVAKVSKMVSVPKKLLAGADYGISLSGGRLTARKMIGLPDESILGGFHVGLDGKIGPFSIWDAQFRPTCHDPRGMTFVAEAECWVDIYLLNTEPGVNGTSAAGKQIADGFSPVKMPNGESKPLTWYNAIAVLGRHGKQLLSRREFEIAMNGVDEGKNNGRDPKVTGHSKGLKSRYGVEQATGCIWTWSRDVYRHENPWMYVLGGYWSSVAAGPRRFFYGALPAFDYFDVGARGRCDHMKPENSEAKA